MLKAYEWRTGYDHLKYLEEVSHTDRIVFAIDDRSAAILGSASMIAERIGSGAEAITGQLSEIDGHLLKISNEIQGGFEAVNDTLEWGFSMLSLDLHDIRVSVDRLGAICGLGFNALDRSLAQTNSLLSRLVHLTETPDQTWAAEKFRAAQQCAERGLWEEAIEFCTKAIEGDRGQPGFAIEPNFHFFRGLIRMGFLGPEPDLVDPEAAIRDFETAARYSGKDQPELRKRSLSNAGWSAMVLGEIDRARSLLREASLIKAVFPEAEFLLAKVLISKGDVAAAEDPLKAAVRSDFIYALRALNDVDFTAHRDVVMTWLSQVREQMIAQVRAWKHLMLREGAAEQLAEIETDSGSARQLALAIKQVKAIEDNLALVELLDLVGKMPEQEHEMSSLIEARIGDLEQKISQLEAMKAPSIPTPSRPKEVVNMGTAAFAGPFIGAIAGAGYGIYENLQVGTADLFTAIVYRTVFLAWDVISNAVIGAVIGLGGGWLVDIVKQSNAEGEERARIEKSNLSATKHWEASVERTKRAHQQAGDLRSKLQAVRTALDAARQRTSLPDPRL